MLLAIMFLFCIDSTSGANAVELAWDPVTNTDVSGYRLYVGSDQSCSSDFDSCTDRRIACDTVNTSCTVDGLQGGQVYYFSVVAYNSYGSSAFSAPPVGYAAPDTDSETTGSFDQTGETTDSSGGSQETLYRINAGGPAVTTGGVNWRSDRFYTGSRTYTNAIAIAGTSDDVLYQSERFGDSFSYNLPLATGTYTVRLHFAEIYFGVPYGGTGGVGTRVFDVYVEDGQGRLNDYDIYSAAGGAATAVVVSLPGIAVSDGTLNIDFASVRNNAKLSAIEVLGAGSDGAAATATLTANASSLAFGDLAVGTRSTQSVRLSNSGDTELEVTDILFSGADAADFDTDMSPVFRLDAGDSVNLPVTFAPLTDGVKSASVALAHSGDNPSVTIALSGHGIRGSATGETVHRINAGGPAVTTGGVGWRADQFYTGSSGTYTRSIAIANTTDDVLFQTERFGKDFSYQLPLATGIYQVNLYLAEIYFDVPYGGTGGVGTRVFDVYVEDGQGRLNDYDIYAAGGGAARAVVVRLTDIAVADGILNIDFSAVKNNAKISAIEVISTTP